jgi:hypothetical protein
MEEIKIKFKLRLNIPKWGKYVEGDEDYFYIDIFNESNGLVRHPIEKHWDIISYELVKNNGVLDDVIVSHLKALTKKIEDSHCYGFEDVLNEYLDSL